MPALIFATRNEGKVREMEALLAGSAWSLERLPEEIGELAETGATFADNAREKALYAAARLPCPVLADDSGLQIDALAGEPGVRSARYIDPDLDPAARNRAVLDKLREVPDPQRTARFVCHLVLAHDGAIVHEATGTCKGTIARQPRGDGGFGYDPIFIVPDLGRTFAEISREEKSARSHRGVAARAMAAFLRDWRP
jgi:XTP/dITP diphosphohydrolase